MNQGGFMAGERKAGAWRQHRGQRFEQLALSWLVGRGLRPVQRNYRCPLGEIDLIMLHGTTLVFVEVRYRSGRTHGEAFETVDRHKQRKLIRTAQHYLLCHQEHARRTCRFDVLGIGQEEGQHDVHWLPDAFSLP